MNLQKVIFPTTQVAGGNLKFFENQESQIKMQGENCLFVVTRKINNF